LPAFAVRMIEDQTVVTTVLDPKTGIHLGDVVLAIDGAPILSRRAEVGRLICASTPQALESRVDGTLLAGRKGSKARLSLRSIDGSTREVEVARTVDANTPTYYLAQERATPVVQMLPTGF